MLHHVRRRRRLPRWVPVLLVLALSVLCYARLASPVRGQVFPAAPRQEHVVQPGETLSGIAAHHGLVVRELLKIDYNRRRFSQPDRIRAGERVALPAMKQAPAK